MESIFNLPAQHRILSALGSTVLHIRPSFKKFLMEHHTRQLSRNGTVHVLDDGEVRRKKNVKITLLDLADLLRLASHSYVREMLVYIHMAC